MIDENEQIKGKEIIYMICGHYLLPSIIYVSGNPGTITEFWSVFG